MNSLNYNVADYIAELLVQLNITKVHGLMGGGAAGLNDGFIRQDGINYICYHHEQSAGYAALAETRLKKSWAILNPTTGCGGTNAYTPVLNAWQDSLPLVIISGNVNLDTCAQKINHLQDFEVRTFGIQENDIEKCVKPITKFASTVWSVSELKDKLLEAFVTSATGRMGPVWLDIPADIQHQKVSKVDVYEIPQLIEKIKEYSSPSTGTNSENYAEFLDPFFKAQRPLLLIGGGVRNDEAASELVRKLIVDTQIPTVATYAGTDVIEHDYKRYLGAIGVKGNRAANFAAQNCDCLLVLGSRLGFGAVGYDLAKFAEHAKILVVDIDHNEIKKNQLFFDKRVKQININIKSFLTNQNLCLPNMTTQWTRKCEETKVAWEIIQENKSSYNYSRISIYHVMEELNKNDHDNCNFVIDAGSISYVGPTALHYRHSRNFIFSPAQADMGCALPSALGVCANSSKKTFCITGDGSFMSNIQELATLKYHNYDLTILLLNNGGYLSISNTQKNNYGENRVFGAQNKKGLLFPDFKKISAAFEIKYKYIEKIKDLNELNETGPAIIEIKCIEDEIIAPYQARIEGKQAGAHDMAPHKDTTELKHYSSTNLNFIR